MSNTFEFTGEWEFKITLPGFAGFQKSDGTLTVSIDDLLNDDPEPLTQQIAALNYLIQNSEQIAKAICQRVLHEYPSIEEIYGELPTVQSVDDIKKYIRVSYVSISTKFKDGVAFANFSANCDWDEEHGLGFGLHREEVFHMGGSGDGYAVDEDGESAALNAYVKKKPQLYVPHPKYNQLKASQASANRYYELELIRGFYNEDFKQLILSGQRDVNYVDKNWGFFGSFIAWAIQYNNQELVDFLMERHVRLDHILHEVGKDKVKIEWLLAHGVSINERSRSGHTLLREQLFDLRGVLMNQENLKVNRPGLYSDEHYANFLTEPLSYIQWLVSKGADPRLADMDSVLRFAGRDYDNERIKRILVDSVKPIPPKETPPGSNANDKWWKFWLLDGMSGWDDATRKQLNLRLILRILGLNCCPKPNVTCPTASFIITTNPLRLLRVLIPMNSSFQNTVKYKRRMEHVSFGDGLPIPTSPQDV